MNNLKVISPQKTLEALMEGEIPWPLIVSKHKLLDGVAIDPNWRANSSVSHYALPFIGGKDTVGYFTPDADPDDFPPELLPYIRAAMETNLQTWAPSMVDNTTIFSITPQATGKFTPDTDPDMFPPSLQPYIHILEQNGALARFRGGILYQHKF